MKNKSALDALLHRPWRLWTAQFMTIVRIESRKSLLTLRGFWIYLLAFAPVAVIAIHTVLDHGTGIRQDAEIWAGIFQFYYLRLAIFFGCMGIFTRLFRGEMIDRSLHYYLLAPTRRELLVLAKFVSGTITSITLFGGAVVTGFALMFLNVGAAGIEYVTGPGMPQLTAYAAIAVLACLAYGAVFLALSLAFKNPIAPGLIVLGWEAINPILPATLQKLSVIFYLRHLAPVEVKAEGIFALLTVVTTPVPSWIAVLGIFVITGLVLVYACHRVRRLEISYTTD